MDDNILYLFHHFHHKKGKDEIHHCGGRHKAIDKAVSYKIGHCVCGRHSINKEKAVGHSIGSNLELIKILLKFTKKCPSGGWHVESGIKI